jgi:hypothetical protein
LPDDLDYINCSSCGSFFRVKRGDGYMALEAAGKIAPAITNSSNIPEPSVPSVQRWDAPETLASPIGSNPFRMVGGWLGIKSIVTGCLFWLLLTAGFFIVGLFATAFILPKESASVRWEPGIFFLFLTIGFGWGALGFLRRCAPGINIGGFINGADLSLSPDLHSIKMMNQTAAKILVAIITWVLVYLIALTLIVFINKADSAILALVFLVGLILGPVLAWIAAERTSIS